ncbi:MAG: hypothetical protein LUO93_09070, partial [Methanomicrobiales archaeon]|nr:hypothetical protein [Methanomicrobiales archaeon]
MPEKPMVSVEIEARYEALTQQLAAASAAVRDGAKAMAVSLGQVPQATAIAGTGVEGMQGKLLEWRKHAVQEARFSGFLAREFAVLGVEAGGLGGALAGMVAGFATGNVLGLALGAVKGLVEYLHKSSEAAEEL